MAVVAGVLYNGVLAFLNARGLVMNMTYVTLSEVLILALAAGLIFFSGFTEKDISPLSFGYFGLVVAVIMCFLNERAYADGARIFAIITVFFILGSRVDLRWVDRCFGILTTAVLVVLLIELVSTSDYVYLFKPASYFEVTRGIEKFSWDKTGLFKNSLGFEGRLSLNPFSKFRTSSLFLEQVSLANFGGVIIVFLLARWSQLSFKVKTLHSVGLVMILLTTSTRTSIALAGLGLLGYWVYPYLSRFWTLALAPVLLIVSWLIVFYHGASNEDDVAGRLSRTIVSLSGLNADSYLGARTDLLPFFADSGYTYLVTATTIFGALAFWIFVSLILPQRTDAEKRCAWATASYFFINLLISGNAVFSIKTAAPLWFLMGSLYGLSRFNSIRDGSDSSGSATRRIHRSARQRLFG